MSKTITSKSKRWAGSVTIADPLTIPQAKLIEAGMENSQEVKDKLQEMADVKERLGEDSKEYKELQTRRISLFALYDDQQLPAVLGCVEKWELENFPDNVTIDNFPASPRGESHKLIEQIFRELMVVYFGEAAVPNA